MASLIIPQRQQQTISIHSPPRIVYIQISADRAPPEIVKAALTHIAASDSDSIHFVHWFIDFFTNWLLKNRLGLNFTIAENSESSPLALQSRFQVTSIPLQCWTRESKRKMQSGTGMCYGQVNIETSLTGSSIKTTIIILSHFPRYAKFLNVDNLRINNVHFTEIT